MPGPHLPRREEFFPKIPSEPGPAVSRGLYLLLPLGVERPLLQAAVPGESPQSTTSGFLSPALPLWMHQYPKFVFDSMESLNGSGWEGPQRSPHATPAMGKGCHAPAQLAPSPIQAGIWPDLLQSHSRSSPWLKPGRGGPGAGAAAGEGRTERGGTDGTGRGERSRALREREGRSRARREAGEQAGKERSRQGRRGKGKEGEAKEGKGKEGKERSGERREGGQGAEPSRRRSPRCRPRSLRSAGEARPPLRRQRRGHGALRGCGSLRGARGEPERSLRGTCGSLRGAPEPPPPKVSAARLWGRGRARGRG